MKDLFTAYRRPTEEKFAEMWRLCVFAFDANMLLNIYRYTPETQEKFFAILERLKKRIWISHQAASEYFKRREDVIKSQLKVYEDVAAKLDSDLEKLAKQLEESCRRHPSIKIEGIVKLIKTALVIPQLCAEECRNKVFA
ncbi:MAG: PIN-like domain-containing protein [Acidobacteriota bacterium]|nr:PIN-like domain-containing protein [Acidobacteriota bacterium]